MLGMMNKGGGSAQQPQGGNPALASLFRNNAPAAPGAPGAGGMLPQIGAPVRPSIGMPVQRRPPQPGGDAASAAAAAAFMGNPNRMLLMEGQWKPAWMTGAVRQTGMPNSASSARPEFQRQMALNRNR